MPTLIRTLRLLSIVIWVGGIIFFAFVLAPVAFHLLPSQHMAGLVVGGTLRVLDIIGLICGLIFWAVTTFLFLQSPAQNKRLYQTQILMVAIMLLGTAYLHVSVLPAMEIDRTATGGDIEAAPATSASKIHFEKLHKRSERTQGVILFCGLAVVILMAGESLASDKLKL